MQIIVRLQMHNLPWYDCFTSSIHSDMCATSSSTEKTHVYAHTQTVVSYHTKDTLAVEKEEEPASERAGTIIMVITSKYQMLCDLLSMAVLWMANVMSLLEFMLDAIVTK